MSGEAAHRPVASTSQLTASTNDDSDSFEPHLNGHDLPNVRKGKGRARAASIDSDGTFVKTEDGDHVAEDGVRQKRKKAVRACGACQRAHLTCDDGRPCERCIKRGCAATCQDGKRKKAKYLQDIEDEIVEHRHNPIPLPQPPSRGKGRSTARTSVAPSLTATHAPPAGSEPPLFDSLAPENGHEDLALDLESSLSTLDEPSFYATGVNFGSEGANLEYSILSSMLSNTGYVEETAQMLDSALPALVNMRSRSFASQPTDVSSPTASTQIGLANGAGFPMMRTRSRVLSTPTGAAPSNGALVSTLKGDEVYAAVTAPYPYVSSYHDLIRHLKEKFDRADIVRVIRALALFRPSLIALQMPLSEEDEIFVEKCFQRTLIEYDKLIGLSGTPTVVWRRTCEICLVGPEFCILTEWKKQDLVDRKRYIFELFDNASVVGYFEQVAAHAFENTTSTVMTTCNLLTPSGKIVPCSFCFSIKRDLFSIPSLIIGQFLPVLNETAA